MMLQRNLTILQLYPRDMNIYGDWGNTLVLKKRAELHGYIVNLMEYNVGGKFPEEADIIIGGGGQDSGQSVIHEDLLSISEMLSTLSNQNVPMLMICGLYQLFGNRFVTAKGVEMLGIGLLDIETVAKSERLIGNVIGESSDFGTIVGYENHSGQTILGKKVRPLSAIRLGAGNNGQDGTEGARINNVIGSYLHGSLLPKNPRIADWMIEQAAIKKYGEFTPNQIDDSLANLAHQAALKRPR